MGRLIANPEHFLEMHRSETTINNGTNMTYEIHTKRNTVITRKMTESTAVICVDGPSMADIPTHIKMCNGMIHDKKSMYESWLREQFNNNDRFLAFVSELHRRATSKKGLLLVCNCRTDTKLWHASSFKKFLEEFKNDINMLAPYMAKDAIPHEVLARMRSQMENPDIVPAVATTTDVSVIESDEVYPA